MKMTAAEWFVKGLQERGVEWIATLCGHGLDPLYEAAKKSGVRLVDTRNEQAAAYAAEAFGSLTRRPGVVAVSSIGHVNAIMGVANAYYSRAPMLLISGAGNQSTSGMGHFQDYDQVALAGSLTKYGRVVDRPERAIQILDEAWRAATDLPPGPVHLSFPLDVQDTEVDSEQMVQPLRVESSSSIPGDDLEQAASCLASAGRPLIVAGSGVYYAGEGNALAKFSETFSVPLGVLALDRDSIKRPLPSFVGLVGALTGGPRLLADADCVILAGADVDYRLGFLGPDTIAGDARILRIAQGWQNFAKIYEERNGKSHTDWLGEARRRWMEFRQSIEQKGAEQAKQGLHAVQIAAELQEVLTDETVLLIDAGSAGQWAHHLLCDQYPRHWLSCGPSGVVGWGLGGAIGARMAFPDQPVILLTGDGAFTFTVAEIECAVRQRLPFVVIVADDQSWGITMAGHIKRFGEPISSTLGPIDFVKLAESLGARGVLAKTQEEVRSAVEEAKTLDTVTVVHVPIVGGNP